MASIYVHLSGKDVDKAILRANGIESTTESQKPKLTISNCFKCHEVNEATAKYCVRCGASLDKNALLQTTEVDRISGELTTIKEALALLMTRLDPETRDKLIKVVKS